MKPMLRFLVMVLLLQAQLSWASTKDIRWVAGNSGTVRSLYAVTYGKGLFVAVGESTILTSSDGINWTPRNSGLPVPFELLCIAFGNGLFVVGGSSGIQTSPDGISWTEASSGITASGIAYGNGLFVAVSRGDEIRLSVDAANWITLNSSTTVARWGGLGEINFNGVTFGNRQFVAVGTVGGTYRGIVSSSDGIVWNPQFQNRFPHLKGIAYGNDLFVAVGGVILTSPNAGLWTTMYGAEASGDGLGLLGVAYGNGQFLAVGGGGLFVSSDGRTWGWVDLCPLALRGIAYGNDKFVVVGDNGTIFKSEPTLLPKPVTLGTLRTLPNGTVQGSVSGSPGQNFLVQASTNLADWLPLAVLITSTNATAEFIDQSATKFTRRFYRAVSP